MNWYFIALSVVFFILWIMCLIFPMRIIKTNVEKACWNTWFRWAGRDDCTKEVIHDLSMFEFNKISENIIHIWYLSAICVTFMTIFALLGIIII